jgi:hypothetical protein
VFEFELAPLDEVPVWGTPPDLSLGWFGLSWGQYWLDLGTARLLEYSPAARLPGLTRFVDYQVARLHEDLLQMLPDILEPLPADVVVGLEDGSLAVTAGRLSQAADAEQQPREILEEALYVLYRRFFDTAYLAPRADIWMWSRGETVVVEWDHRGRMIEGAPAWTASHGRREMATSEFRQQVTTFHRKFMAAMQERIDLVCAHWSRPEVKIDLRRLREEQLERDAWLGPALCPRSSDPAVWGAVRGELGLTHG